MLDDQFERAIGAAQLEKSGAAPKEEEVPPAKEEEVKEEETPEEKPKIDLSLTIDEEPAKETPKEGVEETQGIEDLKLPTDSPRVAERIRKANERGLKAAESKFKPEIERLNAELQRVKADLEKKPEVAPVSDEERKELLAWRRKARVVEDKDFKEKFDSRIETNKKTVTDLLKANFPDKTNQELLEKAGAFQDFDSFAQRNPKGYKAIITAIEDVSVSDADAIRNSVSDNRRLAQERERFIENEAKNAEEWFKEEKAKEAKFYKINESVFQERAQLAEQYIKEITENEKAPFRLAEIPKDALPETKQILEKKNSVKKQATQMFKSILQMDGKDFRQVLDVAAAAAYVPVLKDTIRGLNAQVKELNDKIDRLSNANRTSKGRSLPAQSVPASASATKNKLGEMDFESAIDAVQSGKVTLR